MPNAEFTGHKGTMNFDHEKFQALVVRWNDMLFGVNE